MCVYMHCFLQLSPLLICNMQFLLFYLLSTNNRVINFFPSVSQTSISFSGRQMTLHRGNECFPRKPLRLSYPVPSSGFRFARRWQVGGYGLGWDSTGYWRGLSKSGAGTGTLSLAGSGSWRESQTLTLVFFLERCCIPQQGMGQAINEEIKN